MKTLAGPNAKAWLDQCRTFRSVEVEEIDQHKLGHLMREFRLGCGRNLRDTARAIGLSQGYLSDCERGFRKLNERLLQNYIDHCLATAQ